MQTDYKNLKAFEALTIVLIAIGCAIILVAAYGSLPDDGQKMMSSAAKVLDMHEPFAEQVKVIALVFEINQKFYDEFYLAFTQVAAMPEVFVKTEMWSRKIAAYADDLAFDFQRKTFAYQKNDPVGEVLGATIDLEISGCQRTKMNHHEKWKDGFLCRLLDLELKR